MFSKLISTGSYLPNKVVTNDDLSKVVDTSDEWIYQRTGIKQRHIVEDNEFTSDLGVKSLQRALEKINLQASDLDGIIVATTTPDLTFPATATIIQDKIGLKKGFAFDVQAVCSGFIYALSVADAMIIAGRAKKIAVIGAETFTKLLDWNDRTTCVLFGDGAGAVILEATDKDPKEGFSGILGVEIFSDGSYRDCLKTTGGVSVSKDIGVVTMNGGEVFKQAVNKLALVVDLILKKNNMSKEDISFLVPHQANIRIINSMAKKLNLDISKVITTVEKQANTSAASIPLALDYGFNNKLFKEGDLLLLEAIGGGLSWGSSLIRV